MKSNIEWKQWGKADPLYGVASWAGRERAGTNPWTDEEFYALGVDWHDFDAAWRRTVDYEPGTVLEIGSGAGRITAMLAGVFQRVIATDVSVDILNYARERVRAENISWQVSDGDHIPASDATADAVFSCHVFQHFPSTEAQTAAFREVHRVLKNGGTFFVHLPIHAFPEVNLAYSRLARVGYRVFTYLSAWKALVRRAMIKAGFGKPYMHGVSYEIQRLFADLRAIGFSDVSASAITLRTGTAIHFCVSGRKQSRGNTLACPDQPATDHAHAAMTSGTRGPGY